MARRLTNELSGIRLGADDWMIELGIDLFDEPARAKVEGLQWRVAEDLLRVGTTVIIEYPDDAERALFDPPA